MEEKRASLLPIPLDRPFGDAERARGLLDAQSAENAKFHQPSEPFVERFESRERAVDGEQLEDLRIDRHAIRVELPDLAATAFVRPPISHVVHENLPHRTGRHREEVMTILHVRLCVIDELQIRLVHERSGPEGGLTCVVSELTAGHHAKLAIHKGEQGVNRARIPRTPGGEQFGDVSVSRTIEVRWHLWVRPRSEESRATLLSSRHAVKTYTNYFFCNRSSALTNNPLAASNVGAAIVSSSPPLLIPCTWTRPPR